MIFISIPIVAIPIVLLLLWMREHKKEVESAYISTTLICIAFVLMIAPIITAISIMLNGLKYTYDEFGIMMAITIMEIHLLFILYRMKLKSNKAKEQNEQIQEKEHKGTGWGKNLVIFAVPILFLILMMSESINNFWAYLELGYGLALIAKLQG